MAIQGGGITELKKGESSGLQMGIPGLRSLIILLMTTVNMEQPV